MTYGIHPSKKLVQLYSEKPFQGQNPEDAENFTFVELLNIPTIGNTKDKLFLELLDKEHLQWLESLILTGNKQFVVISQRLVRYIRIINRKFNVLSDLVHILKGEKAPSVILETQNVILYYGFSLSAAKPNTYFQEFASDIQEFLLQTVQRRAGCSAECSA